MRRIPHAHTLPINRGLNAHGRKLPYLLRRLIMLIASRRPNARSLQRQRPSFPQRPARRCLLAAVMIIQPPHNIPSARIPRRPLHVIPVARWRRRANAICHAGGEVGVEVVGAVEDAVLLQAAGMGGVEGVAVAEFAGGVVGCAEAPEFGSGGFFGPGCGEVGGGGRRGR